jgi:HEAT repeat protein
MLTIYLSSTYNDLIEQRNAAYRALRRMHHHVIAMEDYVATDQRPLEKCLDDVAACDLYVGIFAWRYGFIPKENNPQHQSITEREYRKAIETGKPTLIFILDETAQWPMTATDMFTGEGNGGSSIRVLREELGLQTTVSFFKTADDLAAKVSQAVSNWEKEHAGGEAGLLYERARRKYLENMCERYSTVKLPIGSSEGLFLNAVFQPLMLRRDPLAPEDLERKKRRHLLGEFPFDMTRLDRPDRDAPDKKAIELLGQPTGHTIVNTGDEAVEKSPQNRLIILGGPGTGKTTTLKYLAAERAQQALENPDAPLPIFLTLPAFARSGKTLQRYLVDLVEDMKTESIYAEVLWKEAEAGNAFLCLDSLDEVTPDLRQAIIELINSWAVEKGNTWIIGSRFTEYKGGQFKQNQFTEWELLPMNKQLRLELAQRLLPQLQRLLPSTNEVILSPETFVHVLEKHAQAAAWGENPLLFSLAAVVFVKTGDLPPSRATLYREVIEAVLKTREPNPIRCRLLQRMLTELALWLHQSRGRTFSMDDVVTFLLDVQRKSWGDITELINQVISSGVIEIVARDTYGFRHQTFQEYLAAVELARRLTTSDPAQHQQTWELAWSKRTFSRWTEILRLMVGVLTQAPVVGGKTEAQCWLQALVAQRKSTEGDPGDLGLALALKSLVEVSVVEEWLSPQTIEFEQEIISTWFEELVTAARYQRFTQAKKLRVLAHDIGLLKEHATRIALNHLIPALEDRSVNVSAEVVRALGELGERMPLSCLFTPLQDQDWNVRNAAQEVLDEQGGRLLSDPALLDALKNESESVRMAAVQALGKQGERAPIELLMQALQDEDEYVRIAAVEALGKQGEQAPIELFMQALQDEDEYVRIAAVQALGKQGERAPIELLMQALQDEDESMRSAAVEALGKQGERAPIELFMQAFQDESEYVRMAAVQALGKQGERAPIELFMQAFQDEDESVRSAAVEALGKQGERAPIELFMQAFQDKSASVRRAAVEVLGEQEERPLIELFMQALQDKNESVRMAAVRALGKQGERTPIELFMQALQNESEYVRSALVEILSKQREKIPSSRIFEAISSGNWNVRSAAVQVLGKQGERAPIELLMQALQDKNESVRMAAVQVLGEQGERAPIELFMQALQDESESVRMAAVEVLGKQGERAPIELFMQALQDEDESVRRAAVQVLGEQGERAPIELLMQALQDESASVRSAAVQALGKQGERAPIELLMQALQDKNEYVRMAAVQALGKQGERAPIELFMQAFQDENESVRIAAVQVLGKQGERAPIELFMQAFQDKNESVRSAAVEALGKQGERAPIELFMQAFQDKSASVRRAAVRALGKQGERTPIELFMQAFQDKSASVRRAAVRALGKQGERTPIELFMQAFQDENESVRMAAVEALGKQGERAPIELFMQAFQDEDESVRSAAVEVLGEQEERPLIELFMQALQDKSASVRRAAVRALGKQGERTQHERLLALIGDDNADVRNVSIEVVNKLAPAMLADVATEAIAILQGKRAGRVLSSIIEGFIAEVLGNIGYSTPMVLDKLTALLDWHYWQVQVKAAQALGKIRRNIPDMAIKRLLSLRNDPSPLIRTVSEAADDALSEILSLETGIEDE